MVWALGACVSTVQRVSVWRSEVALWRDAERHAPQKVRPAINLGRAYFVAGDLDRAVLWFSYAERLSQNPQRTFLERRDGAAYAQSNLAVVDDFLGSHERARLRLLTVLQQYPTFHSARLLCVSVGCAF